jgi:hypothetical protein
MANRYLKIFMGRPTLTKISLKSLQLRLKLLRLSRQQKLNCYRSNRKKERMREDGSVK